jgi:truncated hemoglobin YjbI
MPVHMRLPIEAPMFDRWLMLWSETAAELFAPGPAVLLRTKAETIARSLKLGCSSVRSSRRAEAKVATLRIGGRAPGG